MKKIALYITAAVLIASCNNSGETKTEAVDTTATTVTAEPAAQAAPKGKIDPVCEMEYDAAWTEYTVHNSDTVWFCSETCKTAFAGNPAKYAAKLN
jgi:YHS domain-containing protein